MTWTPTQYAMLAEMGIKVWQAVPLPERAVAGQVDKPELIDPQTAKATSARGSRPDLHTPESTEESPPREMRKLGSGPAFSQETQPANSPRPDVGERPEEKVSAPQIHARAASGAVSTASHADVPQMDWPQLRAAVSQCTACALCESRTQTVFGTGYEQADWLMVGEAPGEQEDQQGEPFVGKSGRLLDNMLRALQLSREPTPKPEQQVFIANTIKCRPPANRNPLPEELVKCEPYLIRQVALIKPKIILAMGRFAVQSLLRRSDPIGRLRGQVHSYQGVPLIVTYHPAYLLRNPEDKAKAWDDLCLAMATYQQAPKPVTLR